MLHPSELKIEDFNYELPEERVAKFPLANRSESKLLKYKNGEITASVFSSIVHELPENALLVYNNTKVFYARLGFIKSTGAKIEVFCLEPHHQELNLAMQQKGSATWKCMVGNAKKWKDEILELEVKNHQPLKAKLIGKEENDYVVELSWDATITFSELMELVGNVPLPPYLKRKAEESDKKRYQTVYSKHEGSVAAPTAGLHFTPDILESLKTKGVNFLPLTLHVGAGTFQPVKADKMEDHDMHAEVFSVTKEKLETLREALENNNPIVVVGTTSLRALESLFWGGNGEIQSPLEINQWEPYENTEKPKPIEAVNKLIDYLNTNHLNQIEGKTKIIIAPGYSFQFADALITNFHQPKSTLLLLVSAILDGNWKSVYDFALANDFRFLSYGDSSILWRVK
ncbi:MAG: S-adenosylmethionine:tRNA ribosyltransferase-isomerase [Salibacteraceae bacterium]